MWPAMRTHNPYRLSRDVLPRAYRIFLTPDLEAATFSGRVEIDVEVVEPVSAITLHAKNLQLSPATVTSAGVAHHAGSHETDERYDTVTFPFDQKIAAGPATLELAFTGILSDGLAGFYRSTYTDDAGVTHVIATTQFEHSDARRAFPCFDEPSLKATFQVNLTVPRDLLAVSNSPEIVNVDLGNGQRSVSFAPTMVMSSYLVAFVVGPFEATAIREVRGVPVRVITPIGKVHLAPLALEAADFALNYFPDYFAIAYPGEKLDMVAIPDFAFGAMENLGCVTFRETALLVDPQTASLAETYRVAEVVHHELAHMWFGDLVTMEWWEGIWLNEAFATFMQLKCSDAFRPDWHIWSEQAIHKDIALQIDALAHTRAIEYEVLSPDDTQGMFDALTYEKGSSVLRMLEQYLSETTFRDGIRHYLRQHSYANAVTTDLWDALEEVSGEPVHAMMDTWILQGGHPLIRLDGDQLRQEPFAFLGASVKGAIGDHWIVPVLTRPLGGGEVRRHLLSQETLTLESAEPTVLNAGGSGVYRSHYRPDALATLAADLGRLTAIERATLLSDGWATLLARVITWPEFLTLVRGLTPIDESTPWDFVLAATSMVRRALDEPARDLLAAQVSEVAGPVFARLGWDAQPDEGPVRAQLRGTLVQLLGEVARDPQVRAEAVARFDRGEVSGDLATPILRLVADHDRPGDYERFLEAYRNAPTPQEAMRYQFALGSFNDRAVALDAADRCLRDFRSQDGPLILPALMRNETTGPAVWRLLTSRWDEAMSRFSPSLHARLAAGVTTFILDPELADEVAAFHEAHPVVGGYPASVEQWIERMRVGQAFAEAIRPQF